MASPRMKNRPKTRRTATGVNVPGVRGRPIKIAADFDTALAALVAVPSKKRRKAGRA